MKKNKSKEMDAYEDGMNNAAVLLEATSMGSQLELEVD